MTVRMNPHLHQFNPKKVLDLEQNWKEYMPKHGINFPVGYFSDEEEAEDDNDDDESDSSSGNKDGKDNDEDDQNMQNNSSWKHNPF